MALLSDIKRHYKVVEQTHKITKAMHLISTSKMRRALGYYENTRSYHDMVRVVIKDILLNAEHTTHPFFQPRTGARSAYIVIGADKGLVGSYNSDVIKLADKHMENREITCIYPIGHMMGDHYRQLFPNKVDDSFIHMIQDPALYMARHVAQVLIDGFETGRYDYIYLVYTHMESMTKQTPRLFRLLPVAMKYFDEVQLEKGHESALAYYPSDEQVLDVMAFEYVLGFVFSTMVQSFASEQCIRMRAMEAATGNAEDMMHRLTLDMNHARQEAITTEMSEIVGGSEALKGGF